MIPLTDLSEDKVNLTKIKKSIADVIDSKNYILGKRLESLENEFSKFIGARYAVGVGNGTDALRIALRALGVGRGDKVLTVSLTSPFTSIAILEEGAIPVYCDVDLDTWTMDLESLGGNIDKKVKAIMPVHIYGNPSDMKNITKAARNHNLFVIEDACQAHGAAIDNKKVGNWANAAAFSFYPTKNLGAFGDAGMVVTNNGRLAKLMRILRHGGQTKRFWHVYPGFNSRLDEIQSAILEVKLEFLNDNNKKRKYLANRYQELLGDLPIKFQKVNDGNSSAWHLLVIRIKERDKLKNFLGKRGITSDIYYPHPVHSQPLFRGFAKTKLKNTDLLCSELLALPLYPKLSIGSQNKVIKSIRKFFGK